MRLPNSPGILPSQKIREMIGEGLITTASGEQIPDESVQPTALELRVSDPRTITINPGEGGMFYVDEALRRLPRDIYPLGDTRSRYAKVGLSAAVVNEDGGPVQRGHNGRLMLRVESSCSQVTIGPGVPLAHIRFFYNNPVESKMDPRDIPGYGGYEFWEGGIVMHLNLDGECVGYVSKKTRKAVDGRIQGNRWVDFFDPVGGCGRLQARAGELLDMETVDGLIKPNGKSKPYACVMPRFGPGGLQVNTASFIEYGSEGPQALEILPATTTNFEHGKGICYIEFYRIAGDEVPDRVYGPGNGNRNMRFLLGPLFRAPGD